MEKGMEAAISEHAMTSEQWAFANNLYDYLHTLQINCSRLFWLMEHSDEARYLSLGELSSEVSKYDQHLDSLLTAVMKNDLNPNIPIDEFRNACDHLGRIFERNIADSLPPSATVIAESMEMFGTGASAIEATLNQLKAIVQQSDDEGSSKEAFVEMCKRMDRATATVKTLRNVARKIKTSLTKKTVGGYVNIGRTARSDLNRSLTTFRNAVDGLQLTAKAIYNYVHGTPGTIKTLTPDIALQRARENRIDLTEDGSAFNEAVQSQAVLTPVHITSGLEEILEYLRSFEDSVTTEPEADGEGKFEVPWKVRGQKTQAIMAESLNLRPRLELEEKLTKDQRREIANLKKQVEKQEMLADSATKRIETVREEYGKQADETKAELEETKKLLAEKTEQLKTTVESLEEEIVLLQKERSELKKSLDMSPGGRRTFRVGGAGPATEGKEGASLSDLRLALQQVDTLQQALYCVRRELSLAKSKGLTDALRDMKPLNVPLKLSASPEQAKVESLTSKLLNDITEVSAFPVVVDISPTSKTVPTQQYAAIGNKLAALERRRSKLHTRVEGVMAAEIPVAKALSTFATSLTPEYVRMQQERLADKASKLGYVRVQAPTETKGKVVPVTLTGPAFHRLHAILSN